ncbi:MAG: polyribonucleotide nucleotidyltransferase [Candidatus Vogelbacteria bacterium]|nr:polyribonucleotide nucleotidyltransferase [Candidatus Vogelbacteria bacterium]
MNKKEFSLEVGGKVITATFSDLADQTNGAVMIKCGETSIFATAVMGKKQKKDASFFPLVVDYEERFYAAGKILGGQFIRREGRPSEEAILTCRVVDRTIRPLFDQRIRNDIQVVVMALSIDEENDPDILSVIGASLALGASDIPWNGPVGAVRVVKDKEGKFLINAGYKDRENAVLDTVICGKNENINMIETEAKETNEDELKETFRIALAEIKTIEEFQKKVIAEIGKTKVMVKVDETTDEMNTLFETEIEPKLYEAVFSNRPGYENMGGLEDVWFKLFAEKFPDAKMALAEELFEEKVNDIVHKEAIEKDKRPDGRKIDEIRELSGVAGGVSTVLHGSGVFYRGATHVLSVLTLGSPKDSQLLDGMEVRERKYFMHHYNFPPFSTGEIGRMGGINRRAVGHGALAEKALRGILPDREIFPYTIRIVSESMASNGSTSMASVCASSIALMDGGVPIKRPAAGIAMGLMSSTNGNYKILTDIQGPEDHHGDMDFKVAGTREGITAIQLDIKVDGVSSKILGEALDRAKIARLQILDVIEKAIPAPRADISPSAPRIIKMTIDPEKIGAVIGPGGKIIKQITEDTGAEIEIEQDGTVYISGKVDGVNKAKTKIEEITHVFKAGEKFIGTVVKIADFGAFVNIAEGTDGMVHISEIAPFRVANVRDILKEGEKVPVIIKEIDERGRLSLSIKAVDKDFAEKKGIKPPTNGNGGQRPPAFRQ